MSDDPLGGDVLVRGVVYPHRVWLNTFNAAALENIAERVPKGADIGQLVRAVKGSKTPQVLQAVRRRAAEMLEAGDDGLDPESISADDIVATIPVDETMPPR